jgi:hypothetical protein
MQINLALYEHSTVTLTYALCFLDFQWGSLSLDPFAGAFAHLHCNGA